MKKLFLLISVTFLSGLKAQNWTFNCNSMYSSTCEITGKTLTIKNSDFIPNSYNPSAVTTLKISSSTIPRLTSSVCKPFSNLQKFVAREVSLEIVDEDTFVGCQFIKEIDLEKNHILTFAPNTFNRNPTLENLQLWLNRLQYIDDDLFANLTSLTTIDLSSNNISYFSANIARDMEKLKTISLCNNRILDIDMKEMLEYLPKLVTINLRDNDLECDRWREIRDEILAKKLTVSTVTDTVRVRPYGIRKVDGVECLDKPLWEHLKMMRSMGGEWNDLQTNVNATKEKIIQIEQNIVTINDKIEDDTKKHNKEMEKLMSLNSDLDETHKDIEQIHTNTSKLSILLSTIESDTNIIKQDVNQNKVKFETLSKYVDTELENVKKDFFSKEADTEKKIIEHDAKYDALVEDQHGSVGGLWAFVILLAIAVLIITMGAAYTVQRFYNQIMVTVNKVVELKNVENEEALEFVNPHPTF